MSRADFNLSVQFSRFGTVMPDLMFRFFKWTKFTSRCLLYRRRKDRGGGISAELDLR